jgi:TMEM175 potassium channel family protein
MRIPELVATARSYARRRSRGILRGMTRGRLEAFSDAVIAIVMTIMVLELVPPHGATLEDLGPLAPIFLAYILSFAILAIYWNNHHHLLQAARTVSGRVLWANMHLLFWLSLVPFGTAWIGESEFATTPMAIYGFVLLMASFAYYFLVRALIAVPGQNETLAAAIAGDRKGKLSVVIYAAAIPIALVAPIASFLVYVVVALIWIVPDARIERRIVG